MNRWGNSINSIAKALVLVVLLVIFIPSSLAVQQIISFQGKVDYLGELVEVGDLEVTIWDSPTGGTSCNNGTKDDNCDTSCCVYNSTSSKYNFSGQLINGYFDIMLGSGAPLNINYNQYYWIDMKIKHSNTDGWYDINWSGNERKIFESVSGDTFSNDIQINNGSLFVCSDGNCDTPRKLVAPYEGDLYVEGSTEINDNLIVRNVFSINNSNGSTIFPYSVIGNVTIGQKQNRSIPYINSSNDLYIDGSLSVGDSLFADAIIGTSWIDSNDEHAFIVTPFGQFWNWVFNVDTINREVNIDDTFTVSSNATQGILEYNIIGNDTMDQTQPDALSAVTGHDDLYVAGSMAVGGTLYSDVVIGTYSVESNNDPAFSVKNNSGYKIFGVNTIDGSVDVIGHPSDIDDNDTHYELIVNDDVYVKDDLKVDGWIRFEDGTIIKHASGFGYFVGQTTATTTGRITSGSLLGYEAANAICESEYELTHMCTITEMMNTVQNRNISEIADWSGNTWVNSGGPKYAPANTPVDDCRGWTVGSASGLGSFWIFDDSSNPTSSGFGAAVNCGSVKTIACCYD